MSEANDMEIKESIKHRFEHLVSFRSRERALGQNLGEVFISVFHHDVQTIPIFEAAAADIKDAQYIRMSELHNTAPERELKIRIGTGGGEVVDRIFGFGLRPRRRGEGGGVRVAPRRAHAATRM